MRSLILAGVGLGILISWIWSELPAGEQEEIAKIEPTVRQLMAYADEVNNDVLLVAAFHLTEEQQRLLSEEFKKALPLFEKAEGRFLQGYGAKKALRVLIRGTRKLIKVFAFAEYSNKRIKPAYEDVTVTIDPYSNVTNIY